MTERSILHVDMDAFYASVETLDRPELAGKPLIVGENRGRGVVAAASYEARRYGVHSAMPVAEALRRCPQAICVPPRMSRYKEISRTVFATFEQFTPEIEGLSLDEAFLDVTASQTLMGPAESIAMQVKRSIFTRTKLTASVGLAGNKLLAKIASDLNKPNGFCRIGADNLRAILDPLPIQRLSGVGPKTLPKVLAAGISTFGQLRLASDEVVWRIFGKDGARMRERAAGIDARPVDAHRDERSISAEETFAADIAAPAKLRARLTGLTDRACARLRAAGFVSGCVAVKIRRADFACFHRQQSLQPATDDTREVLAAALQLFDAWQRESRGTAVRLLGVGLSRLTSPAQGDLFSAHQGGHSPQDRVVDGIRRRFGAHGILRASVISGLGTRRGPA